MKLTNRIIYAILLLLPGMSTNSIAQPYTEALVKDLCTGPNGSLPGQFISLPHKLVFNADDCVHGTEWWVSDGTTAGTQMIVDLFPGTTGQNAVYSGVNTVMNGIMYFTASDSVHGVELWKTDGTAAGTTLISDITPGIARTYIINMYQYNGKVYFAKSKGTGSPAANELWVTDGTAAGTHMVADLDVAVYSAEYNGRLYLQAAKSATGLELWSTDGTDTGTKIVKDLRPGSASGNPRLFTKLNGYLLFAAVGTNSEVEWMRTDGTDTGTKMIKNIYDGGFGANPYYPVLFNNNMYFSCRDSSTSGFGIWKTDGTEAGTVRVIASPNTVEMFEWNGKLYMGSNFGAVGKELYSLDATGNLLLVKDLRPGNATSDASPYYYIPYNNKLFFTAQLSPSARHIFYTDGTDTGTHQVASTAASPLPVPTFNFFSVVDSLLLYNGNYGTNGMELYKLTGYNQPPTSISQAAATHGIRIYPNPAQTVLNIITTSEELQQAGIYDITGKAILQTKTSGKQSSVDVSKLAPGMYYIRIGNESLKFLKQ